MKRFGRLYMIPLIGLIAFSFACNEKKKTTNKKKNPAVDYRGGDKNYWTSSSSSGGPNDGIYDYDRGNPGNQQWGAWRCDSSIRPTFYVDNRRYVQVSLNQTYSNWNFSAEDGDRLCDFEIFEVIFESPQIGEGQNLTISRRLNFNDRLTVQWSVRQNDIGNSRSGTIRLKARNMEACRGDQGSSTNTSGDSCDDFSVPQSRFDSQGTVEWRLDTFGGNFNPNYDRQNRSGNDLDKVIPFLGIINTLLGGRATPIINGLNQFNNAYNYGGFNNGGFNNGGFNNGGFNNNLCAQQFTRDRCEQYLNDCRWDGIRCIQNGGFNNGGNGSFSQQCQLYYSETQCRNSGCYWDPSRRICQ